MMNRNVDCLCQQLHCGPFPSSRLDRFAAVRMECPAIRELFVPDTIWPKFRDWHLQPENDACHASMLLLALERGHLASTISFAHRYLLASDRLKPGISKQYINDFREDWMNYDDSMERHHKSRMFTGRVVELQCAEWLEEQGWTISGLEAFREGPDIEAITESLEPTAFEVKFIGQQDACFASVVNSLKGEDGGVLLSPYGAANYLLFRAYQAAKQLKRSAATARIAVIVIDAITWFTFKLPLKNGWIDWRNPAFTCVNDPFIDEQAKTNTNLDAELKLVLGGIDSVWIVKRVDGYHYVREFDITMCPPKSSQGTVCGEQSIRTA